MLVLALVVIMPCLDALAANQALLERKRDGNRADAVHRINLFDANGQKIVVDDLHPQPFSTALTCGECHDYGKIRQGWHFSEVTSATLPGRPGEPWILSDPATKTQLPLALHAWKGAWQPEKVGMTPWKFAKSFGGFMPGGGLAEVDADSTASLDTEARWDQSGKLAINCLACHSGSSRQDQAEWDTQIANDNFQWAATAASGIASVEGAVKSLPSTYDVFNGPSPDDDKVVPPSVRYNSSYFDSKNKVFFDIKARPDDNRCEFCHSTVHGDGAVYQGNRDVHLSAGMKCVDCHRNGLNHQIFRGGEDDPSLKSNPKLMSLTCKGCHLGDDKGGGTRMRAPRPKHKGMPPLHLEKLSCTACHSGSAPQGAAEQVRTARNHKLGMHTRGEAILPGIASPVFIKQNGQTHPCNVLWPSFWGRMQGQDVMPLLPEKVTDLAGEILGGRDNGTTGTETLLTEGKVVTALKALAKAGAKAGEPVYVAGGQLYRLASGGQLVSAKHEAAEPYAWPIGHDVRPASQSLGAKGCTECHAPDAPFYFGKVAVANPLSKGKPREVTMCELSGQDAKSAQLFGRSFVFRPYFKIFGFASSGLVLSVLLSYGLMGLGGLCRKFGRRN